MVFVVETLTSFANNSLLLGRQKVAPVESWDEASSQIELWTVFCIVLLSDMDIHHETSKMMALVEETLCICACLYVHCRIQTILPFILLRLIQK